ncbi:hypothetical protein HWV62_39401 [Athelia sp. TMB]|nr:hypothetical protein HWV62_39401 [Athelia sp. TMB]
MDPKTKEIRIQVQAEMSKGQAAIYIQLRTGHAPLNKHLHRIKAKNSPVCTGCDMAHETVKHFLLDCPAYERIRQDTLGVLGTEARSIQTLLSHPVALKPLMKYIGRTGRFGDEYGTMEVQDRPKKKKKTK